VTYPDPTVSSLVNEHFTPVKLDSGEQFKLMRQLGLRWLPGAAIVDAKQRVHHHWVGFLPPELYAVELAFGRAMSAFGNKQLDQAIELFEALVESAPESERAPEALYWQGVTRYRSSGELSEANRSWGRVVEAYGSSLWARKVEIFA